jgi:predicted N-acyltransferase
VVRSRIASTIDAFDAASWDQAARGNVWMRHRTLRAIERGTTDRRVFYGALESADGSMAVAVAGAAPFFHALKRRALREVARRTCFVSAVGTQSGMAIRPGIELPAALDAILPLVSELARSHRTPLLGISDVRSDPRTWEQHGYLLLPLDAGSELVVPRDYDAYLAALGGKLRNRLKRMLARSRRAAIQVTRAPSISAHAGEYFELLQRHHQSHGRRARFSPGLFAALEAELGADAVCVEARRDDRVAGFGLALREGSRATTFLVGFDSNEARDSGVYFALFDGLIRWAIDEGLATVDFGPGTLATKRQQGCVAVPRWVACRADNRWANWLLQRGVTAWRDLRRRRAQDQTAPAPERG